MEANHTTNASRLQELEAAKARLHERRSRLLELQQIDSEEQRLNQEIATLRAELPTNTNV